jgi:hypothetical protein
MKQWLLCSGMVPNSFMVSFIILEHVYSVYIESAYAILMVSNVLQKQSVLKKGGQSMFLASDGK